MQSLNDDMDELFRRASEEYPLKTDGADWKKMMQKMHSVEGDVREGGNHSKDFHFLWLLLLLPIGFICGRYVGNKHQEEITVSDKSVAKKSTARQERQSTINVSGKNLTKEGNTVPDKSKTNHNEEATGKTANLKTAANQPQKHKKALEPVMGTSNNKKMIRSATENKVMDDYKDKISEHKKKSSD